MRRMPLLPQKLERAQEGARGLLPAHDVGPLIDEDGEVAVRLDPFRVHRADDGFRGGADGQALAQLLAAAFSDPGDFGREPLDVLRLAHEQPFGDEQREIGVLVSGGFEAPVELRHDELPDRIAVWPHDDAAAHGRVVGELRLETDLRVPLREVVGFARYALDLFFGGVFHTEGVFPGAGAKNPRGAKPAQALAREKHDARAFCRKLSEELPVAHDSVA